MEPQFRFCTSADGTRIAYATYGSGPPLLYASSHAVSIDSYLAFASGRAFFDALASRTTLVAFDRRGSGSSSREVTDLSPMAEAADVAAVATAAGIGEFTLFADIATTACVHYAAQQPEGLQRLVIWSAYTETNAAPRWAADMRRDWSYARRIWASMLFPMGPVAAQREMSEILKHTLSGEMGARRFEIMAAIGAEFELLLPRVQVPTLLLERQDQPRRRSAMRAARLLPNGRLRYVAGRPATLWPDHEPIVEAVFEFMGLSEPSAGSAAAPLGTTIILFTDIVDSTPLTERLGDAAFHEQANALDASLRAIFGEAGGTAVEGKLLGDGVLATFPSAAQAIEAAMRCGSAAAAAQLQLHVGLHAGDVIREKGNVFGGAVNIANRICGLSAPGEVLVSQTVRDLARTSAEVTFDDRGEHSLKGIADPVRVFAVRAGH